MAPPLRDEYSHVKETWVQKQGELHQNRLGKQRQLLEQFNPYTIFETDSLAELGSNKSSFITPGGSNRRFNSSLAKNNKASVIDSGSGHDSATFVDESQLIFDGDRTEPTLRHTEVPKEEIKLQYLDPGNLE